MDKFDKNIYCWIDFEYFFLFFSPTIMYVFFFFFSFFFPQEFEERQMRWEQREGELERNIHTMEKQTAEITGAAARVSIGLLNLPL